MWDLKDWTIHHRTYTHPQYGAVTVTNYTSPNISLMTGAARFTLNPQELLPFPDGDHAILRQEFQMVGGSGWTQTPLSEVYNHHCAPARSMPAPCRLLMRFAVAGLIGARMGFALQSCEGSLFLGAGAEMRGMPVVYPEGYGLVRVGAKGTCGGNLHFIRTEDLKTHWVGLNNPNGSVHAATKVTTAQRSTTQHPNNSTTAAAAAATELHGVRLGAGARERVQPARRRRLFVLHDGACSTAPIASPSYEPSYEALRHSRVLMRVMSAAGSRRRARAAR